MDPTQLAQLQSLLASNPKLASALNSPEELGKLLQNPPPDLLAPRVVPLKSSEVPPNWESLLDSEGGIVVEPTQSFVMKFREEKGGKVFVNITGHSLIEDPEAKELVQAAGETGFRVPMSVGPIREDFDAHKEPCKVFDVIVSENIASTTKADPGLLELLTALLQSYSIEKFGLDLQTNPIFPKLKYKGKSILPQRIKAKRAPKVSTLSSEDSKPIPRPKFNLRVRKGDSIFEFDGRKGENYVIEILLPLLVTGSKLLLEYNDIGFHLRAGVLYELSLRWPDSINTSSISAEFNVNNRTLVITFNPASPPTTLIDPIQGSSSHPNQLIKLENTLLDDIV